MSIKIFGIEVERRTDVLAFAAFIISLGSIVTQAINLIQGPQVELQAPRQVLFNLHQYPDGHFYLRISAKMIYLNTGSPGYDDIIKAETAKVLVDGKNIDLIGQDYVEISSQETGLDIKKISDADPVQIQSGAVISHETYYAPWPSHKEDPAANFITDKRFFEMLKRASEIQVIFKSETYSGTKLSQKCHLKTEEFIHHIQDKKWSAPVCKLDSDY